MNKTYLKKKPKNQHWVPVSYLNYFSIPETRYTEKPKAWIFSKDSGEPRSVPLRTFAKKKYLYSPQNQEGKRSWETEDKLGSLESLMGRLWPLFENNLIDFEGDETLKKSLALFISTLYLRHPSNIDNIKRIHGKLVSFYETLPMDEAGNPLLEEVIYQDKTYQFDNLNYDKYKSANKNELQKMFVNFLNSEATHCTEILLQKRWSIIFSELPLFITTDKPVVVINRERDTFGLKTKGTIIIFPINPRRVLVLDDMYHEPNGRYYPLGKEGPGPINLNLWRNAENFMVSPRHTDQVCAEMLAWTDRFPRSQVVLGKPNAHKA